MSSDIEEFLRRAAARRQQRQAQARQGGRAQPARPAYAPPTPEVQIIEPAVEAEVVEAQPVHEGISQQVAEYFGSGSIVSGDAVDQADERMHDQLEQMFDHRVGRLSDTTAQARPVDIQLAEPQSSQAAPAAPSSKAEEFARMFRSPQGMRQAIILSEILNRPEDRW